MFKLTSYVTVGNMRTFCVHLFVLSLLLLTACASDRHEEQYPKEVRERRKVDSQRQTRKGNSDRLHPGHVNHRATPTTAAPFKAVTTTTASLGVFEWNAQYEHLVQEKMRMVPDTSDASDHEGDDIYVLERAAADDGLTGGAAADCVQRKTCATRMNTFQVGGVRGGAISGNAFAERNCFCDAQCIIYDDCCADFHDFDDFWEAAGGHLQTRTDKPALTCERYHELDEARTVYVVDSCPKSYADRYVRDACVKFREDGQSGFFRWPVSGVHSGILYANVFCAICSGEPNVTFWRALLVCSDIPTLTTTAKGGGAGGSTKSGGSGSSRLSPPFDALPSLVEGVLKGARAQAGCWARYLPSGGQQARMCKANIGQCAKGWSDKKVRAKCRSTSSYVYVGDQVYRNRNCALCNNIDDSGGDILCEDPHIYRDFAPVSENEGDDAKPFQVTLDLNTGRATVDQDMGRDSQSFQLGSSGCSVPDDVYDPYANICRRLSCTGNGFAYEDGECVLRPGSGDGSRTQTAAEASSEQLPFGDSGEKRAKRFTTHAPVTSAKSATTRSLGQRTTPRKTPLFGMSYVDPNCDYVRINASDFVILNNGSLFQHSTRLVVDAYDVQSSGALICRPKLVHGFSEQREIGTSLGNATLTLAMFQFDDFQSLLSIVGIVVSLTTLCLLMIVYCCNAALRTLTGKCLLSLAIALFISQLTFLVGIHWHEHKDACLGLAVTEHYFLLATFFWINIVCVQLYRAFSSSRFYASALPYEKTVSGDCCRFFGYSLYAWFVPACITAGALSLDNFRWGGSVQPLYAQRVVGAVQGNICWITSRDGLFVWFLGPLALLFLIDTVVFIFTLRSLCKRRPEPFVRSLDLSREEEHRHWKRYEVGRFVVFVFFAFDVTLTWAFAAATTLFDIEYLLYAFIACHALQGIFLISSFLYSEHSCRAIRGRSGKQKHQSNGGGSGYIARRPYVPDSGSDKVMFKVTSI